MEKNNLPAVNRILEVSKYKMGFPSCIWCETEKSTSSREGDKKRLFYFTLLCFVHESVIPCVPTYIMRVLQTMTISSAIACKSVFNRELKKKRREHLLVRNTYAQCLKGLFDVFFTFTISTVLEPLYRNALSENILIFN